jgi:hypothetical protein
MSEDEDEDEDDHDRERSGSTNSEESGLLTRRRILLNNANSSSISPSSIRFRFLLIAWGISGPPCLVVLSRCQLAEFSETLIHNLNLGKNGLLVPAF